MRTIISNGYLVICMQWRSGVPVTFTVFLFAATTFYRSTFVTVNWSPKKWSKNERTTQSRLSVSMGIWTSC